MIIISKRLANNPILPDLTVTCHLLNKDLDASMKNGSHLESCERNTKLLPGEPMDRRDRDRKSSVPSC